MEHTYSAITQLMTDQSSRLRELYISDKTEYSLLRVWSDAGDLARSLVSESGLEHNRRRADRDEEVCGDMRSPGTTTVPDIVQPTKSFSQTI